MTNTYNKNLVRKNKINTAAESAIMYVILILTAFCVLAPLYIVLVTSFMSKAEAMSPTFKLWPEEFTWSGYEEVFSYTSGMGDTIPTVVRGFINTMIIVIPTSIIGTFISALSAYSFAKINFKSKKFLFTILLGTMMIPGTISMIPAYVIYDSIGWTDTFLPLMIPGLLGGASSVFFLRQFYYSIPDALVDAAKIDGLSNFGIFLKIMLPLSTSAVISQFVLAFVNGYNDFLTPLIYLQTPTKYTLQIALNFFRGTYTANYSVVMAGAVVSLVPTILIYLFGQRYFVDGIATTGMKL